MVMACRNALASCLSGLRSRNSPCRWAERRHILRPKLLSGLESLTTSPTHSMVSHPTPTPSPSLPSPPSIPGVRGTAGCAMTLSSPAVACLPPSSPSLPKQPVSGRSSSCSRFSRARSFMGNIVRVERGRAFPLGEERSGARGRARVFRFLGRSGQLASFTAVRLPVERAGRVRRGRGARAPSPAARRLSASPSTLLLVLTLFRLREECAARSPLLLCLTREVHVEVELHLDSIPRKPPAGRVRRTGRQGQGHGPPTNTVQVSSPPSESRSFVE